ncbi:MAG: hypothetical protein DI598_02535 [Pseudopedobacter saltans]|uniref:DUF4286 domain-containing protein n=1 Tax=Pseudopedobacter saltans TaxID=151895 RepID=A0A2W5H0V9_9SPHI|nr:MAG: hypothetical protein DI598_02535 [Pseudopedobacter saltans]
MDNTLYISNETFKVDWSIHEEWLEWVNNTLIPFISQSDNTQWVALVKLMDLDDSDGPTYALQTGLASKADYNRFAEIEMPPIMQTAYGKWGELFLGFRTLMEVLSYDSKKKI